MDSPISPRPAISPSPSAPATASRAPVESGKARDFSLSNLQVLLILLVCGVILCSVTWIVAGEFGRLPISLMDICTSVLPGSNSTGQAAVSVTSVKP